MKRRTGWIASIAAVVLLLAATVPAFGYGAQVKGSVTVAAHGIVSCGAPFTLTATFVDANGAPVSGQSVVWSFVTSPSASDTINHTPTVTNSHGVASTTVTLALVDGTRGIRATADDVSATAVLSPSCTGAGAVLPITSTLPHETASSQAALLLGMLLVLVFAVSGGLTLRRLAATHR